MPFTLAHAAAALPLRRLPRGRAVFPALVIGCFIPDVPYFLPEPFYNINAHQLPGLVLFGIPCGWALHALWFAVLLEPIAALLPARCAALLKASRPRTPLAKRALPATLAFLAGALSHVAWDAFTHRRGLIVHAWPALAQPLAHVDAHALPPYFLLQHGSTLVGMACLALHVRWRLRELPAVPSGAQPARQPCALHRIAIVALLCLATAAWVCCTFLSAGAPRLSAYNVVCCCVSAAAAVTILYALAWHGWRLQDTWRTRRQRPSR